MFTLTAEELRNMAIALEETGAKFYRNAAGLLSPGPLADLFNRLADWEDRHRDFFYELGFDTEAGEFVITDPDEETAAYLRVLAGSRVFSAEPKCLSGDAPTRRDILQDALDREKESVVFYSSLRQVVTSYRGKEMLERITREELHHLQVLARELEASS
ncbi:ferritin-like domain-containing protein [Aminiphilus circumscriptus]|uniref:ferritin-like domain-containing protein n=1 Tax=Aminiphilus circumscriptus TaxID=290732 RepID=UPI0004785B71|nr:ferritin family protein [Aminiphilus circumscriptus]